MTGEVPNSLRLFVAIELPQTWLDALAEIQSRMKQALGRDPSLAGARVRWVRPEGIHLTLKFIGNVPPDRLEPIQGQLAAAVPGPPGFTLALGRAGAFGERRAPRVLWAGVQDQPQFALLRLAEDVETWLAAAEVPRERRGFRPHLTLARLPDDLADAPRRRAVELTASLELPSVAPFGVEAVSLMQSHLGPGGARYERLGRWPA